jgi:Mg2+ and Co2+ transporter CorA
MSSMLGQRPKGEPDENHLFVVTQMHSAEEDGSVLREEISMFLGRGFLLTHEEAPVAYRIRPIHERHRKAQSMIGKMAPDSVAYALLQVLSFRRKKWL